MARSWWFAFLLVAISGFFQFTTVSGSDQGRVVHGDAVKYVFYAYNLRHHDTFSRQQSFGAAATATPVPDKLTQPGYPWFLSHFLGDGDPDRKLFRRVGFAQAFLGIATTLLAFLVALRLMPPGWAFAVGFLVATQPHLVVIDAYLLTEAVFTPLVLAFVLASLAAMQSGRMWQFALAGLLLGIASLVRPPLQAWPWLVLVAAWAIPRFKAWRRPVLLAVACYCLVLLPWQIRNAQVPRQPGEPDLLVQTLYHGSFPGFMYRDDPATLGYPYRADPDAAKHSADLGSALSHIGTRISESPARTLSWIFVGKPLAFLSWNMVGGAGDIFIYEVSRSPWLERPMFRAVRAVHRWLHGPLMLLAFAGAVVAVVRRRWLSADPVRQRAAVFVGALLLVVVALHAIGLPLPRYAIPFKPLLFAMGVLLLRAFWLRLRKVPA